MYYDKIDYSIIKESWESLQSLLTLPYIIHIVGTNGKGSTGRYIATLLYHAKKSVLHYSSPHILKFNERIWIDGEDVTDDELEKTHQILQTHLKKEFIEKLTYFEYTTLLALILSDQKEYLILEAGLGGEFDATNVIKNDLSVFTPIGYDHQSFLGNTLEEIAITKMKSCDTRFILSPQVYNEVVAVKNKVLKDKEEILLQEINNTIDTKNLPQFLKNNFFVALNVLNFLKIDNNNYQLPKLKGRFEYYKENIIIDVGHNPLAAREIAEQLKQLQKKVILIYNCFDDKDYKSILELLKPYLIQIQIIPCFDKRIISSKILKEYIQGINIECIDFDRSNIEEKKEYLVFGSFSVVEQFLKEYTK